MTGPSRPTTARWFSIGKDVVLFVGGCVGVVYEARFAPEPRALLIALYALALGLPWFNGLDKVFQRAAPPDPPADPAPPAATTPPEQRR